MQITELDKLNRDLAQLIFAKMALTDVIGTLGDSRRTTARWIALTMTRTIGAIDHKIGIKKQEIADREAEIRIWKARSKKDDERELDDQGENDGEADRADAADFGGRAEESGEQGRQRAGGPRRRRNDMGQMGAVRSVVAGSATGTAEECLRRRYKERNGLRDWQREAMEAESEGRREALDL